MTATDTPVFEIRMTAAAGTAATSATATLRHVEQTCQRKTFKLITDTQNDAHRYLSTSLDNHLP